MKILKIDHIGIAVTHLNESKKFWADGDNVEKAQKAKKLYETVLPLICPASVSWIPPVVTCSALEMTGIDEIWEIISDHRQSQQTNFFLLWMRPKGITVAPKTQHEPKIIIKHPNRFVSILTL